MEQTPSLAQVPAAAPTARNVFLYILVVITLSMSAVNLGTLGFQYINLFVPDPSITQCWGTSCQGAIRWSLASLVVAFPVLVWAWRILQRDVIVHPERRSSRARRWLLYFTLFVAGLVLLGDVIALVYSWLGGDLTMQFLLKLLVMALVSGTVFGYFQNVLQDAPNAQKSLWIGRFAVVMVSVAVLVGFVSAGSPFQARKERLDSSRVSHLSQIQGQITRFFTTKGYLPKVLDELKDPVSSVSVPVDPVSKSPYEYHVVSDRVFQLCASFETTLLRNESSDYYGGYMSEEWSHGVGRVCFDRTLDPDFFPVKK
jgi:hypothetical protein